MLGRTILMTAHALGIVTVLACAVVARQSVPPVSVAAATVLSTDVAESGRMVLSR